MYNNNRQNDINTEKKYCHFCVNGIDSIDYKQAQFLRRFTSSYAKISPKRKTGVCAKHQRKLSSAIKRARYMALLPYVS